MNLRKILLPVLFGLILFSFAADARYVYVLPQAGDATPMVFGYTDQMAPMGSGIPVPATTFGVLTSIGGDKAFILAADANAPVTVVDIQNGQFVGTPRVIYLEGQVLKAAKLTADGTRILFLTGTSEARLFPYHAKTEARLSSIPITGEPKGLAIARDISYAFVLTSPNIITVIDMNNGQKVAAETIPSLVGADNITLSPTGNLYITAQYAMVLWDTKPPFKERARSQLGVLPGPFSYSPNGRYALSPTDIAFGRSVVTMDFTDTSIQPAGKDTSGVVILDGASRLTPDGVQILDSQSAMAYSSKSQRLYQLSYPNLNVREYIVAGAIPTGISGLAVSDEVLGAKSMFYNANGFITKVDTVSNSIVKVDTRWPGRLVYGAATSTAPPNSILGYGGDITVGPSVQLRPFTFRIFDATGRPVYNAPVSFGTSSTSVQLSSASAITDGEGYVTVTATSPAENGAYKVTAVAGAAAGSVDFTVTGGSGSGGGNGGGGTGPVPKILKISGDGQLVSVPSIGVNPIVIRLVDAADKPLADRRVDWTAADSTTTFWSQNTTTDANGRTEVTVIPSAVFQPNEMYKTFTIVASTEIGNASFKMMGIPFGQNPAIDLHKPTQEAPIITAKLGSKIDDAVRAYVASGAGSGFNSVPIPGVALNISTGFTDPTTGPVASCEGGLPMSGADGFVSCNLIITGKLPGSEIPLTIGVGGQRQFDRARLVVLPGDPTTPVIVQGNNQTGKPGARLPLNLVAKITDGFGNNLEGTAVSWTVSPAGAVTLLNTSSQADASGNVSTSVQLGPTAGKVEVKVTAAGKTVTFAITIEASVAGITKVSGDNQPAAVINTVFASPLTILVTDAQSRPVTGAAVVFAVTSGSATVSPTTVSTGADGRASATVTAGSAPGSITVSATITGFTPIIWSLSSRLPGPTLSASSFTNWMTNEVGVAPGNLVLITGPGLAPTVKGTVTANILTGLLPFTLEGVTVQFRNLGSSYYAPIYRVSNVNGVESVLIQAPFELAGSSTDVYVDVNGGNALVSGVVVRPYSPGILEDTIDGRRAIVAIRSDGFTVTTATPARPGEVIRVYAIGVGQTTPIAETNHFGIPGQRLNAPVIVGLDDKGVEFIEAHLAENLIGVYEVLFRVPANQRTGNAIPIGFIFEPVPGQTYYSNPSIIPIGNQ